MIDCLQHLEAFSFDLTSFQFSLGTENNEAELADLTAGGIGAVLGSSVLSTLSDRSN